MRSAPCSIFGRCHRPPFVLESAIRTATARWIHWYSMGSQCYWQLATNASWTWMAGTTSPAGSHPMVR